jgi:hydrophobic/amphiphilic exporter-1 (mainly G- bacteria), HAE1 family
MNFIRFCVERKVTVAMFVVTAVLFGVMSWFRLDREFMPELQFPQLVVLTSYPNASSQEVENLVTKPVEESVGTVRNVQRLSSSSREGISIVTVEFVWGTNMDMASLNLREKVDLAKAKLPRDAGEPRIEKFNPFALPVITLSLSGPMEDHQLLAIARRPVAELLEKSRGVAAVSITGGREREIRVELEQAKLTARGLPILDVGQAISRSNITYPAGNVKDKTFEYVVRVLGQFEKVDDLGNVAVTVDRTRLGSSLSAAEAKRRKNQGPGRDAAPQPIPLHSLGKVVDTYAETSSYSRYDGRPTISLSILKQAEANVVRVAEGVLKKLPDIRTKLPEGVSLDVVYDQSVFVKNGINGMIRDGTIGGILAFLVLVLFLGNMRDAVVVSAAIPLSLLGTLTLLEWKGLSLNTITLAGLAIGIGNLTDGAIVVQENIARHRAMGKSAKDAAADGAEEVFGAVTSSNMTTVAVFLPLIFVTGIVGQVFGGLSWSIIFSQITSQCVAFTLIPMLSALLGEREAAGAKAKGFTNPRIVRALRRLEDWGEENLGRYNKVLLFSLKNPGRVLGYASAAFLVSMAVMTFLPKALFPKVEGNQILMRLDMPMGTSLASTNETTLSIENALLDVPGIAHRTVTVGSIPKEGLQPLGAHQAQIVLDLKEDREHSAEQIVGLLKEKFKYLKRGRLFFFEQGGTFSFLGGSGAPVMVEVKGYDLKKIELVSGELARKLKEGVEGLYNVRTSLSEPAPELQLEVRRDSLANVSMSVQDLAETALTALKGKVVSKFREGGKEIDIRLRLREEDRANAEAVQTLYVHSPLDVDVPLGSVASVKRGFGPSEIQRFDQQRTIVVSADLAGRSINDVAKDVEAVMGGYAADREVALVLTGESARMADSFRSLQIVLALSILFVFMIMASQFESLWQPFLILFSIPLALIGMGPALLLRGMEVSAMAGMGVVLLAGIVVNNGIVLIDFVNQAQQEGISLKEALAKGCHTRIRPILMTAICTILGMLPLSLGIGEGADMQAPMAVVVVSGLIVSTCLTLVVLPALFVVVDEKVFDPKGRAEVRAAALGYFALARKRFASWIA